MALTDKLTAVGDAIRQKTGSSELIPLSDMPNEIHSVYKAGYEKGKAEGGGDGGSYDEGFEAGKKSEREKFWNEYTNRSVWSASGVFYGGVWDFDIFYPTCDIRPVGNAERLFYAWENENGKNQSGSLKKRLEECGVVLDTSQATNLQSAFGYSFITEIPTIDCTNLGNSSSAVFAHCYHRLLTIEKVIVNEAVTYNNWFNSTNITNITFDGVIGQDLDLGYSSRLTKASIESIISHLSDSATGKTLTLSKTAVENAFTDTEWDALESTKTNWTISLV